MVVNQLFIVKPHINLINKIIKAFGLNNINDTTEFSYLDMDNNNHNTLNILHNMKKELGDCYIPCKRKIYVDNMNMNTTNNKTAITIFKHFLKPYNYDLYSREGYVNGYKCMLYKIITKKDKLFITKTKKKKKKKEIVIVFD